MSDVWSGEIVDKALNAVRYFFLMAVLASVFSLYKHFIQIFWQERIDQRRHPLCLTAKHDENRLSRILFNLPLFSQCHVQTFSSRRTQEAI